MQFISLKRLLDALNFHGELSGSEGFEKLLLLIEEKTHLGKIQIGEKEFTKEELTKLLKSLDSKKLVFYDWIDQHKELLKILEGQIPSRPFDDKFNWKGHTLFKDFQKFLSTFLQKSILEVSEKSTVEHLHISFSFLTLLPEEDRIHLEQKLFRHIKEQFTILKPDIEKVENEQDLTKLLQDICNHSVLKSINYLSRASYSSKLWYVDQILWIIHQKGCTVRLANWILKQLETIELNPEHKAKITLLKKDLLEGKIKTKNTLIRNKFAWKLSSVLTTSVLLILISLIVWFVIEKPYSNSDSDEMQTSTSYEQFTKEERIKIDSLLKEIQRTNTPEEDQIDPNQPIFGNGISVSVRVPWRNDRMEDLYSDLLIDASLHENNLIDSCNAFTAKNAESQLYSGVTNAKESKGNVEVMMKNESGYDVYFIAFENEKGGKIFSSLIKKGSTQNLKFKRGYKFLFLAGNQLGKFISPKNATEVPSSNFDHHFCKADINFSESLLNIYELANPQKGKNKLLFSGDLNAYFTVIDLYGFLILN